MRTRSLLILVLTLIFAMSLYADDVQITIELPAAVKTTLKKEIGDGKVIELSRNKDEGGVTTYSARVKVKGHEYEIEIEESGRLKYIVNLMDDNSGGEVAMADVPAAAKAALNAAANGADVAKVHKEIYHPIVYTTEVAIGKDRYEIRVTDGGLLVSKHLLEGNEEEPKKEGEKTP